jgi:hypothetical protein
MPILEAAAALLGQPPNIITHKASINSFVETLLCHRDKCVAFKSSVG